MIKLPKVLAELLLAFKEQKKHIRTLDLHFINKDEAGLAPARNATSSRRGKPE